MVYTIRTTSQFHQAGMAYTFFFWGLFTIYCIGYQLNRLRIYYVRKSRINGKEDNVVKDLPLSKYWKSLDYMVRIPWVTNLMAIKHVLGITLFIIINLIFLFFAPFTFNKAYEIPPIGLFDRRAAFIGMANWGFVFFLAQRNSLLPKISGLTFEELIPFHRIISRIGLAEYFPHFIWRMIVGYRRRWVVKDALFRNEEYTTGSIAMFAFLLIFITSIEWVRRRYFEIFYWSHVIFLIVAVIFSCWHEHTCFAYFIPCIILWFADRVIRTWQSWFMKTSHVRVEEVVPQTNSQEGVVRVFFEHKAMRYFRPGQYVFAAFILNGKKLWEWGNWHPFTISEYFRLSGNDQASEEGIEERIVGHSLNNTDKGSKIEPSFVHSEHKKHDISKGSIHSLTDVPITSDLSNLRRRANNNLFSSGGDSHVIGTFHIKALGQKTKDLLNAASSSSSSDNKNLKVYIDGPFGPQLQYQDYPVVALFATGVGITPALCMIKDIVERRNRGIRTIATDHIYLTWSLRVTDEIHSYMDMFHYWVEKCKTSISPIHLTVNVFATRMKEGPNIFEGLEGFRITYGQRPDIAVEMDKIKTVNAHRRVFAHACGSDIFTQSVVNQAIIHNFDAFHETFEF
ncbi:ferric reductase like transmembrane component-domain-containing protein [Cokeromyces recurvatus]|uniref:ferric reductase like transmembrane component-domain-containing protein n=1 Tax=Cokeromyces recurvatus TaxID=90255 RepID=UPI00222005FE|nr:ferric reductase like transmembrane component-domain-containing protein [Cokeromyces recurvatus]KAI7898381.1 ferric reductase like transmembrane component-domain-containing protein [Cokeromyces recurvatus]